MPRPAMTKVLDQPRPPDKPHRKTPHSTDIRFLQEVSDVSSSHETPAATRRRIAQGDCKNDLPMPQVCYLVTLIFPLPPI